MTIMNSQGVRHVGDESLRVGHLFAESSCVYAYVTNTYSYCTYIIIVRRANLTGKRVSSIKHKSLQMSHDKSFLCMYSHTCKEEALPHLHLS